MAAYSPHHPLYRGFLAFYTSLWIVPAAGFAFLLFTYAYVGRMAGHEPNSTNSPDKYLPELYVAILHLLMLCSAYAIVAVPALSLKLIGMRVRYGRTGLSVFQKAWLLAALIIVTLCLLTDALPWYLD